MTGMALHGAVSPDARASGGELRASVLSEFSESVYVYGWLTEGIWGVGCGM